MMSASPPPFTAAPAAASEGALQALQRNTGLTHPELPLWWRNKSPTSIFHGEQALRFQLRQSTTVLSLLRVRRHFSLTCSVSHILPKHLQLQKSLFCFPSNACSGGYIVIFFAAGQNDSYFVCWLESKSSAAPEHIDGFDYLFDICHTFFGIPFIKFDQYKEPFHPPQSDKVLQMQPRQRSPRKQKLLEKSNWSESVYLVPEAVWLVMIVKLWL